MRITKPPSRYKGEWHWLHSERSWSPVIAQWLKGMWYCIGEDLPISPEEMGRRGWEYHEPAYPRHKEYRR